MILTGAPDLSIEKRSWTVEVSVMIGLHEVGTFVLVGSSSVSFSKIAVKSNDRHFSYMLRVW